jgi:hypothetical protein
MNWFERYGIPGTYFVVLSAAWVYSTYTCLLEQSQSFELGGLISVGTFLPIGYLLSILTQAIYLNWRRCIHRLSNIRCIKWFFEKSCFRWLLTKLIVSRNIRNYLGFHTLALANIRKDLNESKYANDESLLESLALLRSTINPPLDVENQVYVRNWISRRMDVIAINQSICLATILSAIIGTILFFQKSGQHSKPALIILVIVSVFVFLVTVFSSQTLKRQVVAVIEGMFRKYKWDGAP